MIKKQAIFWFDVTTTMRWKSSSVGITKTEHELAQQLINNPNVCFCVYENNHWKVLSKEILSKTIYRELPKNKSVSQDPSPLRSIIQKNC